MRYPMLMILLFSLIIFTFPYSLKEQPSSIEKQKELMERVLESDIRDNIEPLKRKISEICFNSRILKKENESRIFLKKLLGLKRFSPLYYYIYLKMAELSVTKEKFFMKKAMELSGNENSGLESVTKLYEFHKKKGDIKKEIFYLENQARLKKKEGNIGDLEKMFIILGNYYLGENDLFKSLQKFFEAQKYSKKFRKTDNGYIFNQIAKIFMILDRRELARKYLKKALDFAIKFSKDDLRISVFNNYGNICFEDGAYDDAVYYNNLSLGLAKERDLPGLELSANFLRSKICFNTGKELEGLGILKSSVDAGIRTESYRNLLPIISEFIRRTVSYGNLEIATFYLDKLDDIYAPYYRGYFFYYFLNAIIYEQRENFVQAEQFYLKTIENLEKFFAELNDQKHYPFRKEITNIYSRVAQFNFRMFDRTNDVKFLKKAVFAGEVKNSYMFSQVPGNKGDFGNIGSERKRIIKELEGIGKKLMNRETNRRRKTFYRKRINDLNVQLMELNDFLVEIPKKYRKFRISDLNIKKIQDELDPETVVIKFIVLENNSYAFVISRGSVGYKKLERGSRYVKQLTNTLLRPIEDFAEGDVDFLRVNYDVRTSHKLFNILLYDVLEFQKDKKRLIIIPDNELFKIPFEALVTGIKKDINPDGAIFSEYESVRFLIEDYSVEYFLSLFHLKKKKHYLNKTIEISAFGNPDIGGKDKLLTDILEIPVPQLDLIPSSEKEIKKIRKIWGDKQGRYFTGINFTKKNFIRTAPRSRIIHLATHFISNEKYPWYSLLLFSPGKNNDPLYYVSDISKLRLKCDLIFLSTCKSSENHLLGYQVIHGMTASLYNSGVRSMIASLWPVNEFSAEIIPPFYSKLNKNPGRTDDLAGLLRDVKITFMKKRLRLSNGQLISMSHPVIWANFNLYKFFNKK